MTPVSWHRSLLRSAWDTANRVFFNLRCRLQWQRRGYREIPESKEDLFGNLPAPLAKRAATLATELRARYQLASLYAAASRLNYLENLFLLDLFDQAWSEAALTLPAAPRILDVGAKNWYYVRAVYQFFQYQGQREPRSIHLTGIELDAYRVYADWHSRYDYAVAYMQGLPDCRYLVGDFLDHREQYDVVLLLFPFLLERTLLQWGLPLTHFQPLKFLQHALDLLTPAGILCIVNQGEQEASAQLDLIQAAGYQYHLHREHVSVLMSYTEARYVTIVRLCDKIV